MDPSVIYIVGLSILAVALVAIPVGLARWAFRIDTIVFELKNIKEEAKINNRFIKDLLNREE